MRLVRWFLAVAVVGMLTPLATNASGWLIYQQVITDDAEHDVLPAGAVAVDEDAGISYRLLSSDSAGNFKAASSSNYTYDAGPAKTCTTVALDTGVSEFELCLQLDGGVTIQRTAGNNDIDVVSRIMWIS